MKIIRFILLFFCCILVPVRMCAQPLKTLTVDDAYRYGETQPKKAIAILDKIESEDEEKPHYINMCKGDIFLNRQDPFDALRYYKRAYYDPQSTGNQNFRMDLLTRMVTAYDMIGNFKNKTYCASELYNLALRTGDKGKQAEALFALGTIDHFYGKHQAGYRKMETAIEQLECSAPFDMKDEQRHYFYSTLIDDLLKDGEHHQALLFLRKLLSCLRSGQGIHNHIFDSFDIIRKKQILGQCASVYAKNGKEKEADRYYKMYESLGHDEKIDDISYIMPYLESKGMFANILSLIQSRLSYLKSIHDTINEEMPMIYDGLGQTYSRLGNYKEAARYLMAGNRYRDNIQNHRLMNAMTELSSNYQEHDRELAMQRTKMLSIGVSIGLVLLSILISLTVILHRNKMHARIIMEKNRAMVGQIDELIVCKRQLEGLREQAETNIKEATSTSKEDSDAAQFGKIKNALEKEKLYLDPTLTRDRLISEFNIPKNQFSGLFQKYTGTSYAKYVNQLRLIHAAELMKQQPNYTVDAIAQESGFASLSTFYRLFCENFSMTPAEYRKLVGNG